MDSEESVPTCTTIELNGRWPLILKWSLVLVPMILTAHVGFSTWVTVEIYRGKYFREFGARYTASDAQKERSIRQAEERRLETLIRNLPPMVWQTKILALEQSQARILEQNTKILVELERLKTLVSHRL